ncbi:uncharacterized protein LOC131226022 [Magnolia sinica]|uniref:uncharacterized protein LOC131226022 n=1 Tax=Magnolia sinica TaxID=86752 RepID=UPI002659D843|nr:uncharacterized protein LOC131226022 [Magnolia sinica]
MGNYSSCHFKAHKPTAKFVDSDGNLQRLEIPVKAAELMLESPGHVICQAEEIRRTRRVSAMRADEELEAGKIYLLFPVGRANCKASDAEMARIDATCRRMRKGKSRGCKKVFPDAEQARDSSLECHVSDDSRESDTGFPGHQLSNYRPWTPVLETIDEGI